MRCVHVENYSLRKSACQTQSFQPKVFDMPILACMMRSMKTLKQLVTTLRERGYSQARIGRIAGVSQMTISRWEKESPTHVNVIAQRRLMMEIYSSYVKEEK